jgi:phospholipase C
MKTNIEKIKHVVVLMFENRSFDHIFGALPGVNGLFKNGQINKDYYNLPDPLSPPSPTNLPVYPTPIDPSLPQHYDFNHNFGDGMMPDLFGPTFTVKGGKRQPDDSKTIYTSGYAKGAPIGQLNPVPQTYPKTNSGFYSTYRDENNNTSTIQGQAALTYFKDGDLKVFHTLAKEFVLFDNWHCDMPGHTEPNRCFIHTATTKGVGIDDTNVGTDTAKTIFEAINEGLSTRAAQSNWKMYAPVGNDGCLGQLDTAFLNSNVQNYPGVPITEFATDCENGTLPFYSFIMCWTPGTNIYTDTSMHPNALVQPGENLLAAVYNTLRKSPHWKDTLLVVTFDENGGIYDHVFPPTTTPPVPDAASATQYVSGGTCGNQWILDSTFDFSLLGLRVPAMLISPWLAKGIDSTQYQNTSVVRFLIDKINEINAISGPVTKPLTQRDATAPSLETAFTQFNVKKMRTDCPAWITPYATLPCTDPQTGSNAIPFSEGSLTAWKPQSLISGLAPVPYIQELMNIYVAPLPGHPDSGKKITQSFPTNADVLSYTQERTLAAREFHKT